MQFNNVKNINNRILDLIVGNVDDVKVTECALPLTKLDSHHPALEFFLNCTVVPNLKPISRKTFLYNRANYDEINNKLLSYN